LFKRIITNRLVQPFSWESNDLHEEQYGFRERRSIIDAILRVRSLAEAAVEEDRVALAASLDIANAFNTLPWKCVGDALAKHGVSRYLVEVTREYFRERQLESVNGDDSRAEGESVAGSCRDRSLDPYYGTSPTIRFSALPFSGAAIPCVMLTTR